MAQYYPQQPYGQPAAQNLQFFPSSYGSYPGAGAGVPSSPSQAAYGGFAGSPNPAAAAQAYGGGGGGEGLERRLGGWVLVDAWGSREG